MPKFIKDFHKKYWKANWLTQKIDNKAFTINIDAARKVILKAFDSAFEKGKNIGLEETLEFENDEGIGRIYAFRDKIIHASYFAKIEKIIEDDINENTRLKMDI